MAQLKHFWILALVSSVVVLGPPAYVVGAIIDNPSFETGDFQSWMPDAGCTVVDPDETVADPAPDGTYYARQAVVQGAGEGAQQVSTLSRQFWGSPGYTTCTIDIGWWGNGFHEAVIGILDQPQTEVAFIIGQHTDLPDLFWWDRYTLDMSPFIGDFVELRFTVWSGGPGTEQRQWVDNLVLLPEPASAALWGTASWLLLLRNRKRRRGGPP